MRKMEDEPRLHKRGDRLLQDPSERAWGSEAAQGCEPVRRSKAEGWEQVLWGSLPTAVLILPTRRAPRYLSS